MEAPPSPDYIPGPEVPPSPDYIPGLEAPPSPDYIPRPEAPPSPDYIPGPEAPPSPDYIPGPEYPRYITESKPEMEPEEEDGDDEKSEEDSIDYPTSRGDNDADDDGDDFLDDDADDEDEEDSSDKPFEEGETAATPPPFRYRVAARIYVQPHMLMPFRSESEVERLLAIPTPPLSPVSPTSYPLPPLLMPLPIFTPLLTSSFPLPSSLPSTSCSESIPEADIPLRKRARFTTPTGGYKRRERRYFRTLSTTYAQEVAHSRDYCTQIMDYCQSREVHTRTLVTQIEALQRDKMAPKRTTRSIQVPPVTPAATTTTTTVTEAQLQALIDQGVAAAMDEAEASRVRNGYGSNGSGPRLAQAVRVSLTWWNSHVKTVTLEVAQALPWKTLKKMITDKYCPRGEIKKLKTELWELKTKGTYVIGYSLHFLELALMCDRTFPEESDRVEKYIGGVLDTIH
nr:hypothetical protein [Tanacetum cinerariifolium]